MKKCFVILVSIFFSIELSAQYLWTQKASLPGPGRYGAVSFVIGSKAYICSGTGNDILNFQDMWEYDKATDTWTQKANMPGISRRRTNIEVVNGIAYMMGGVHWNGGSGNNTILSDFWSYDPTSDTWTQKADLPFGAFGAGISFSIGSEIYFGIGLDQNQTQQSIWWMYNTLTDTWTQKTSFPGSTRVHGASFRSKDRFFFGLGITTGSVLCDDLWLYNASTDTWIQKADFPGGGLYDAASFYVGDNGYIVGGYASGQYKKAVWEYSYNSDNWTYVGDYTGGFRCDNTGFSIGITGYCGFGVSDINNYNTDLWEFTPNSTGIIENHPGQVPSLVFPNPAYNFITVVSDNIQKIEICDISNNKLVMENYKNENKITLNTNSFPNGLYFITIVTGSEIKTQKFVKF
ncbi:MAG TPA: T9SS type A sorting domain-containing protein [Bacteroidales bacterium]|nr:T9SS type A sorting domain-containing protein [Bacteroidales bacterium]HQI69313.1 T9SS type A sorting domain-containing protein [Bacteroidales bacterium]